MFQDDFRARQCLQEAEKLAEEVSHWWACAKAWRWVLKEISMAEKFMEKINSIFQDHGGFGFYEYLANAERWNRISGEPTAIEKCLNEAEKQALYKERKETFHSFRDWFCGQGHFERR